MGRLSTTECTYLPTSPRPPYPFTTPSPRHHQSRPPRRHQARHRRPMSTSPSRCPLCPYPSSTPSPRHRRYRSARHRRPRYHRRSTSSPRRSTTLSTDSSPPRAPAHLAWWSAPALQELRRWVKWAGGAERREGVHMVHTSEEVRTRTPADLNEATLEAIKPQAAWEALLRDAVQGLRPPYTHRPSADGSRPPVPRPGPSAPPPHPATTTPGRGRVGAGEGQGIATGTQARGHRGAPSEGRRP